MRQEARFCYGCARALPIFQFREKNWTPMVTPADAPHHTTANVEYWRVGDVILGRQLGGPGSGTLRAAKETIEALKDLVDEGERLPMLYDAKTVGWMDADARAYSRRRIGKYLSRVAVVVSWEKRQAHEYAFRDVHRDSGVEIGVFTDRQAALDFISAEVTTS